MHKISFNLGDAFWYRLLFLNRPLPLSRPLPPYQLAAASASASAGLIYFKTSQTLEQHVRSTKFLACLTRLCVLFLCPCPCPCTAPPCPALCLLLLPLAFAVKKP